ncbi:MAG: ABC transporter permease [Bacteroidota bacterium]
MRKLLRIEAIKTFSSNTFRSLITLHLVFFLLVILLISKIDISLGVFSVDALFQFPHVYDFFAWVSSWFNILLAIIIIVLVSNEFRFGTFKQHIIDGLNHEQLITGKVQVLFIIAVYGFLLVLVSSMISGLIMGSGSEGNELFQLDILFVYFLQTLAYVSMGLFFAVLFRNNALSIVSFILYLFPGEVIIRKLFFPAFERYFPAKLISDLTPFPEYVSESLGGPNSANQMDFPMATEPALSLSTSLGMTAFYFVLFIGLSYWLLKSRSFN